jgi:predicted nucleotidyltransferase component of viral defense system
MFLHEDKEQFKKLIEECTEWSGIEEAMLEKDYYVTLMLNRLLDKEPLIIFKGGTCLSKCYKVISRFSEDIDINLENVNSQPQSRKKKMSENIKEAIGELGFSLTNPDQIFSGRSYNNYKIAYPSLFQDFDAPAEMQVETMFLVDTFPIQKMGVSSFLYDYLIDRGYDDMIKKYSLEPYEITAQSLERTFVDKVFALGTHYLEDRMRRQSRHLYDLYKIYPHIQMNEDLIVLFDEVRRAWSGRKGNKEWSAAEDVPDLPKLLNEIIATEAYRSDYEKETVRLLFEDVSYDEVISSFKKMVSELAGGSEM